MTKRKVQEQFGTSASAYATSEVHAKGDSLARLLHLTSPKNHWRVLDVATAAGHTAHTFAPHVKEVIAADITFEMLAVATELSVAKGIDNIYFSVADAEMLPFPDGHFDLVTCRIAAHHFPEVEKFVTEAVRVLCPTGILAVTDNTVPGSYRSGREADRLREVGRFINAFDKLRDLSHVRALSAYEWEQLFYESGLRLAHQETFSKAMDFDEWADRMHVTKMNKTRLKAMLIQAPEGVAKALKPDFKGQKTKFSLAESIFVGVKEN